MSEEGTSLGRDHEENSLAHSGIEERFILLKQTYLTRREGQRRHLGVKKVARPYSESFVNTVGDTELFTLETEYSILQALSGGILFLGGK